MTSYGRAALPFLFSCHMIRCTATTYQKCQHPTPCVGRTCGHIMGNNIQPCDHLTPCHLMEGRAVRTSEKGTAKKKITEILIHPGTHSLSSHLQKHFQVTFPLTAGQLEVLVAEHASVMSLSSHG